MIHTLTSGIQRAVARLDPTLGLYFQMLNMGLTDVHTITDDLLDLFPDFFYVKNALGKDAKPIKVYKIRTMQKNANEELRQLIDQYGIDELGKVREDPRITRLGEILRGKSIDELPNLLGLARKELMLVGPRPRTYEDWLSYPAEHRDICLQVKPGCIPSVYADVPESVEDQMRSNERFVQKYLKDPVATSMDYSVRALNNLLTGKIKNR